MCDAEHARAAEMDRAGTDAECVLPGLLPGDALVVDPDCAADAVCALTLESVLDASTAASACAMVRQEGTDRKAKRLLAAAAGLPQVPPLRVRACGHVFSAFELLMLVSTRGFQCPVCRHGSGLPVLLDAPAPRRGGIPAPVWALVSALACVVRMRRMREALLEAEQEVAEMHMQELSVVQNLPPAELVQMCSFEVTVAGYMSSMSTDRNVPNIPKMLYRIPLRAVDTGAALDGRVLLQAGRCRMLSKFLNTAKWYTVRVDMQLNGGDGDEFPVLVGDPAPCVQHRVHAHKRAPAADQFPDVSGERMLTVHYDACEYSGRHMVRCITLGMHIDGIRHMVTSLLEQSLTNF